MSEARGGLGGEADVVVAVFPLGVGELVLADRVPDVEHEDATTTQDSTRLGEGTGACLATPIVQSAARILTEMATLDSLMGGAS